MNDVESSLRFKIWFSFSGGKNRRHCRHCRTELYFGSCNITVSGNSKYSIKIHDRIQFYLLIAVSNPSPFVRNDPEVVITFSKSQLTAGAKVVQVIDNGKIGIQPPLNTILCARLLIPVEFAGRNRGRDAFLEADFREVMNGCDIN